MDLNFWKATVNKGGGERRRKEVAKEVAKEDSESTTLCLFLQLATRYPLETRMIPNFSHHRCGWQQWRAAPHGYTLLMGALTSHSINAVL